MLCGISASHQWLLLYGHSAFEKEKFDSQILGLDLLISTALSLEGCPIVNSRWNLQWKLLKLSNRIYFTSYSSSLINSIWFRLGYLKVIFFSQTGNIWIIHILPIMSQAYWSLEKSLLHILLLFLGISLSTSLSEVSKLDSHPGSYRHNRILGKNLR